MSKVAPNIVAQPKNLPKDVDFETAIENVFEISIVSEHRNDSYKKLMRNRIQRNEFIEHFFSNILNVESKNKMKSLIAKAVADPRNKNDDEIFQSLKANLDKDSGDIPSTLLKTIKGMYQGITSFKALIFLDLQCKYQTVGNTSSKEEQ